MSAAEPARTPPTAVNSQGDAAVIDISARGKRANSQGRWRRMCDPAGVDDAPEPHSPSQETLAALAERVEETFNEHRLSLTDAKVADAFGLTLEMVKVLLAGAHAQGVVDGGQYGELAAIVEGAMAVPGLVQAAE
ncbi:hypothetical protein [Streptomyces sp. NBC_00878]|uniref:hypothetical protein n=1 Tax=Streptomyces sp. NBC_00878 TaxID=2975854 RepID=UPI00225414FF|nr:hypothetical protein [Streptomyces sp. NBC_00878]MCX4911891.1 hypothetical protein [Streptomyces sp. NBC_00878]